jgi:hypothetical protein
MIARKEVDPGSTLVFLDDHLHTYNRIAGVREFGIRHVVVEDNYKLGEGEFRGISIYNLCHIISCK